MAKAVLLSAVLAIVALPIIAAREKDPKVGLKRAILYLILFNLFYIIMLRFFLHSV